MSCEAGRARAKRGTRRGERKFLAEREEAARRNPRPASLSFPRMARLLARRALMLALAAANARAEGSNDGARELSHRVTVAVGRGHARLVAERTLEGAGARPDVAQVALGWPESAVVDGLALRARGRLWRASVLDAARAEALFSTLIGVGEGAAQPTALVDASGTLSLFPLRPGARASARVEGVMSTTYSDGVHTLRLPALGTGSLPARVTLLPEVAGDRLFVAGEQVAAGATFLASAELDVALEPARPPGLALRVAAPSTGKRAVLHLDVEAAKRLSARPSRADVVVIVDTSRSLTAAALEAARVAAMTYLARLPDAHAQLITFDRRVDVRTDGWRESGDARSLLARLPLVRRNGSELDAALSRAGALFDARGGRAPRRVLVLGDLLTRAELELAPSLRRLAAQGVLTHLVTVSDRGSGLSRDDEHELAGATRATGGLVWSLGAKSAREPETIEELVRPVRLDRLEWRLPGTPLDALGLPGSLAEGEGRQLTASTRRPVPGVRVRGELWAAPFAAEAAPTEGGDTLWSALALTADLAEPLTEDEQRTLALRGHAVSSVTSLLVLPAEARGSRDGRDDLRGLSLRGSASSSDHGVPGMGRGRVGTLPRLDGAARLRALLSPAWRACGGLDEGKLSIETTRDEVAHARVVELPATAPSSLGACLREAAFSLELPAEFSASRATWVVRLGGADR